MGIPNKKIGKYAGLGISMPSSQLGSEDFLAFLLNPSSWAIFCIQIKGMDSVNCTRWIQMLGVQWGQQLGVSC